MREQVFLLFTPIVASILAATFLILWQRDTARRENMSLAIGWGLVAIGFLISQLSPPDYGRAPIPVTHVFYTLGAAAIAWGVLHRVEIVSPLRSWLSIALIGAMAITASQLVKGDVTTDIYLSNTACGLIFLMCAQLFAQRLGHDLVERMVLWSLILVTAQFFIRPAMTMMFDGEIVSTTYRDTVYYNALHTTLSIGSLFFGVALVTASIKDQMAEIEQKASVDALSGLLLRGEFETRVQDAIVRADRESVSVALVIGDIDHFKQVNDIWGHQVGDRAIGEFGTMVSRTIRDCDIAGRIGGEEFCVLVWNADQDIAARLAERFRIRATYLQVSEQALDVRLTASFGVCGRIDGETYREMFNRADKALYQAKQNDRNCVVAADAQPVATQLPLLASPDRPARTGVAT